MITFFYRMFLACLLFITTTVSYAQASLHQQVRELCHKRLFDDKTRDNNIQTLANYLVKYDSVKNAFTSLPEKIRERAAFEMARTYYDQQIVNDYLQLTFYYYIISSISENDIKFYINNIHDMAKSQESIIIASNDLNTDFLTFSEAIMDMCIANEKLINLELNVPEWFELKTREHIRAKSLDELDKNPVTSLFDTEEELINDGLSEENVAAITNRFSTYLRNNIYTFYINKLYEYFRDKEAIEDYLTTDSANIMEPFNAIRKDSRNIMKELQYRMTKWCFSKDRLDSILNVAAYDNDTLYNKIFNNNQRTINEDGEYLTYYDKVDVQPVFPYGDERKWAIKRCRYPYAAEKYRLEATVTVDFLISEQGIVTHPKISKIVAQDITYADYMEQITYSNNMKKRAEEIRKGIKAIETEAIKVIRKMPKWIPAKIDDRNVATRNNISVTFSPKLLT
ncbi:MAG: energy transducer TonB, partial [Bacteroidaceae bacterium]|nr:energy transducer TonB [Bacteroidaceae bacterium]